jgi:hypothetical protein
MLAVGDVMLGVDQEVARQPDNPLIGATTCRRRQFTGSTRDVNADDGEVATLKFPDVWAALAGGGLRAVGVRVRADAFDKNHNRILVQF